MYGRPPAAPWSRDGPPGALTYNAGAFNTHLGNILSDWSRTVAALFRTMVRIRAFENAAETASQGGVSAYGKSADGSARVRGPLHLSTGQEAVPAGVCAHLRRDDYLTSTHRGHGHTLAKGADLQGMMSELFGKASGFNGGKGGSMHLSLIHI